MFRVCGWVGSMGIGPMGKRSRGIRLGLESMGL